MNTDTRIWTWTEHGLRAYVELVNNMYRWQIWELWLDQQGRLQHEGKLVVSGHAQTLKEAKEIIFELLPECVVKS